MKFTLSLRFLVGALLVVSPLASQNVNMGRPQEIKVQHHPSAEEIRDRLNLSQVQNDAKSWPSFALRSQPTWTA